MESTQRFTNALTKQQWIVEQTLSPEMGDGCGHLEIFRYIAHHRLRGILDLWLTARIIGADCTALLSAAFCSNCALDLGLLSEPVA